MTHRDIVDKVRSQLLENPKGPLTVTQQEWDLLLPVFGPARGWFIYLHGVPVVIEEEKEVPTEQPYCEYTFGQFMCGEPVERWGRFCDKHRPKFGGTRPTFVVLDETATYDPEADYVKDPSITVGQHVLDMLDHQAVESLYWMPSIFKWPPRTDS